jgi:predicted HTH domain antitoxin
MQITIDIPDEYIQSLEPELANLPQLILETLVVEAYKAQRLSSAEVGRILSLNRFEVDAFLKQHQAYLHYTIADFNQDLQTLQQVQPQQ